MTYSSPYESGTLSVPGDEPGDMHFDQRTQRALREFGLSTDEISDVSEAVVAATDGAADDLETFFADLEVVYSDMDRAHSTSEHTEHDLAYVDLHTHAADLRGYVKFDGWGAYVQGGRVLSEDVVELALGETVNDRVRFAVDPRAL